MPENKVKPPLFINIIAILMFLFGLLAFLGSLFLWGEGFLLDFPEGVNLAFPITDILINGPASIIAAIGLWRMKKWGYPAAQFVAGFYLYASVYIFVEMFQAGPPYAPAIFAPQVLAVLTAIAAMFYSWRIKELFN
jgi:hypothetical protein